MELGRFISIEGYDGCGKTTTVKGLKVRFPNAVFVHEPGTTPLGNALSVILKEGTQKLERVSEVLLFIASMTETSEKVINPALREGKHVFADRWYYSTKAYQFYPFGDSGQFFDSLIEHCGICHPDINIIISVPYEVAILRQKARSRPDNYEARNVDYQRHVFNYYATECPGVPIDGTKDPGQIVEDIAKVVEYGEE